MAIDTKLVINFPKPRFAVLPISLGLTVHRFSGIVSKQVYLPHSPLKASFSLHIDDFTFLFPYNSCYVAVSNRTLLHFSLLRPPNNFHFHLNLQEESPRTSFLTSSRFLPRCYSDISSRFPSQTSRRS